LHELLGKPFPFLLAPNINTLSPRGLFFELTQLFSFVFLFSHFENLLGEVKVEVLEFVSRLLSHFNQPIHDQVEMVSWRTLFHDDLVRQIKLDFEQRGYLLDEIKVG